MGGKLCESWWSAGFKPIRIKRQKGNWRVEKRRKGRGRRKGGEGERGGRKEKRERKILKEGGRGEKH